MILINTCALYGATTYANSWLGINVLVVVISLMAIAVAYSLSSFFPASVRGRIRGFVRFEMIQVLISIMILVTLLGLATTACSVSSSISNTLTGKSMDPFLYANYYIGSKALNGGLTLLSNIYGTSVQYSVLSGAFQNVIPIVGKVFDINKGPATTGVFTWSWLFGGKAQSFTGILGKLGRISEFVSFETGASTDLSLLFSNMATIYLDVFSPIILIAVGLLFIQYLAIPIMQYTAFTIVLPVAIACRSIAFFSSSLGDASNALIALALAFYIIYPMMIAFDSWAIGYVFSTTNPSATYLNTAFTINALTPSAFFKAQPSNDSTIVNAFKFFSGSFGTGLNPWYQALWSPVATMQKYVDAMAQFLFQSVLLFALNIAVTVGLAVSVYKGLKSGLGEAGRFW